MHLLGLRFLRLRFLVGFFIRILLSQFILESFIFDILFEHILIDLFDNYAAILSLLFILQIYIFKPSSQPVV